jgi:hypothetical protein
MYSDTEQLRWDLVIPEFLNLQPDESADVCGVSVLLVFIRMLFNDDSIKRKPLKTMPSLGKARGEDIFRSLCAILVEMKWTPPHMVLRPRLVETFSYAFQTLRIELYTARLRTKLSQVAYTTKKGWASLAE